MISLLKKNTKASLNLVQQKINVYFEEQDAFIKDMAQIHIVDEDHIRKMISHASTLTSTRRPSIANTILHFKSQELNNGWPSGERLKLKEIQQNIATNPDLDPARMSKGQKKELIEKLVEHQAL
ncbi:hypothetical protein C0992_005488 [Termitomyces sp. T32_za158]|nr:hypothetical protein C0992_005488 [Termitomyces sp. T32_za158]